MVNNAKWMFLYLMLCQNQRDQQYSSDCWLLQLLDQIQISNCRWGSGENDFPFIHPPISPQRCFHMLQGSGDLAKRKGRMSAQPSSKGTIGDPVTQKLKLVPSFMCTFWIFIVCCGSHQVERGEWYKNRQQFIFICCIFRRCFCQYFKCLTIFS